MQNYINLSLETYLATKLRQTHDSTRSSAGEFEKKIMAVLTNGYPDWLDLYFETKSLDLIQRNQYPHIYPTKQQENCVCFNMITFH